MIVNAMEIHASAAIIEELLVTHILPLLPGASLSGPHRGGASSACPVCHHTRHSLRLYVCPEPENYFSFERTLPFSEEERSFIEGIVLESRQLLGAGAKPEAAAQKAVSHAVARQVAPEYADTLLQVIRIYESWRHARRHGQKTAHTTGIGPARGKGGEGNLFALSERRLLSALGSSPGTLVVIDSGGGIRGVDALSPAVTADLKRRELLAPILHADVAVWAKSRRKAAIRLTEDGVILLFSRRRLLFAKQGASWSSLPHCLTDPDAIQESIVGVDPATLKAVYLTALDTASGKTGISIGVVRNPGERQADWGLEPFKALGDAHASPQEGERLYTANPDKNALLLATMVNDRKFHEIPRAIRAEICALGGVLILDGSGGILAMKPSGGLALGGQARPRQYIPGRGYMELFNRKGLFNLRLAIC